MPKSEEFNREGDADPKKVVTRTGPLGLVPVMYVIISLLFIIGFIVWFRS